MGGIGCAGAVAWEVHSDSDNDLPTEWVLSGRGRPNRCDRGYSAKGEVPGVACASTLA